MDSSDNLADREARTAGQDRTENSVDAVITGRPGSGLVLRVGRQGRETGQFINLQGICYSDADGGLILVADSNCACVQASSVYVRLYMKSVSRCPAWYSL